MTGNRNNEDKPPLSEKPENKRKITETPECFQAERITNDSENDEDSLSTLATACPSLVKRHRTYSPPRNPLFEGNVIHGYETDVPSSPESPVLAPIVHQRFPLEAVSDNETHPNSDEERSLTPVLFTEAEVSSGDEWPSRRRSSKYDYPNPNNSNSSFTDEDEKKPHTGRFSPISDGHLSPKPFEKKVAYMSKPSTAYKLQTFFPIPSTSKDSRVISENDKIFNESLNCNNNNSKMNYNKYLDSDDDEDSLPDIVIEGNYKDVKKKNPWNSRQALESLNNNLHADIDNNTIDLNGNVPVEPEPVVKVNKSPVTARRKAVEIGVAPRPTADHTSKIVDTIVINEDSGSVSNTNSAPEASKETDIIDVEDFYKNKMAKGISEGNPVNTEKDADVPTVSELSPDVEITGVVEPPDQGTIQRTNHTPWSADVEFVNEIPPDEVINSGIRVTTSLPNSEASNVEASTIQDDIVTIVNGFFGGRNDSGANALETNAAEINDLQMVFSFLTDTCMKYNERRLRKRRASAQPIPVEDSGGVSFNNENAEPVTNATTSENGERRLGDCPICMDNLANSFIASTTCGHVFCLDCIQRALRTNGKRCPTCRKVLKGAGYHQVFL